MPCRCYDMTQESQGNNEKKGGLNVTRRQFVAGTVGGLVLGAVAGAAIGSVGFPQTKTETSTETGTVTETGTTVTQTGTTTETETGSSTTTTVTQSIPPNLILDIPSTWDYTADVVIVGSGGAGHAAALGALESGLSVLILEKNYVVGGSTALSGGNEWIPHSPVQLAAGITRSSTDVLEYVNYIGAGEQDDSLINVYLANGPAWIQHLQTITDIKFSMGAADQYFLAPGILPNNGSDTVSPAGSGAAIIAALDPLISSMGAQLLLNTQVTKLYKDATGTVLGVSAVGYVPSVVGSGKGGIAVVSTSSSSTTSASSSSSTTSSTSSASTSTSSTATTVSWPSTPAGTVINVKASKGVIMASGGFDWNSEMLINFMRGPEDYAEGVLSNTGDGQMMGSAVGGQLANMNNVSGQTLYLVPSTSGYEGVVAVEDSGAQGKPGAIGVNLSGNRFIDECLGGHLYFRTMHEWSSTLEAYINHPCFTILDSVHRQYYSIAGIAAGLPMPSWVATSDTIAGLATSLGINPTQLESTVATFNANAAMGLDPEFGRGQNILDQSGGDQVRYKAGAIANPCLAPVSTPPFYGLQLHPGMTGTVGGLKINTMLQVLDWNNQPIPGLYAAGCCSGGFWGEGFPGSGSNVGPALVMGWLAGKSVAGKVPSSELSW